MDAATPPPAMIAPAPAPSAPSGDPPAARPVVTAPSEIYPRDDRERELCEKASSPDWLYLGVLAAADVASVWADGQVFKFQQHEGLRLIGPSLVGLSVGATIGGGYLALPKCSPHWVEESPAEGDVRPNWTLALAMAMLGGAMGASVVGVETGPLPIEWTTSERSARILLSGMTGFGGALLPYLLPPKTWRAARELENLRATGDGRGAFVSYTLRF